MSARQVQIRNIKNQSACLVLRIRIYHFGLKGDQERCQLLDAQTGLTAELK